MTHRFFEEEQRATSSISRKHIRRIGWAIMIVCGGYLVLAKLTDFWVGVCDQYFSTTDLATFCIGILGAITVMFA
ncbi:MAG: hypothetical protein WC477_01775 [Patescibacteria group bacterium]